MKLIKDIVKHLLSSLPKNTTSELVDKLVEDRKKTYRAFTLIDDNSTIISDRLNALEAKNLKYHVRATHDADQTSTTGVALTLAFNTTIYPQLGNMHDVAVDNDKFFIRRNGVYDIKATVRWENLGAAAALAVRIILTRNGVSTRIGQDGITVAGTQTHNAVAEKYLYVDDVIEIEVEQSSGGDLDIISADEYSPVVSITERMEDLDPSEYGLMIPEDHFR